MSAPDPQLNAIKGRAGVTLPAGVEFVALHGRTYTQSEVEKYFTEAQAYAAEYGVVGDADLRDMCMVAYLRGRFGMGGAR